MSLFSSYDAFQRKGWSLRTRFYFISGFLTLMILTMAAFSIHREYRLTTEDMEREKKRLVEVSAISVGNILMNEELAIRGKELADNFISKIMDMEDLRIAYIIVTDVSGKVIGDRYKDSLRGYKESNRDQLPLHTSVYDGTIIRRHKGEEEIMEAFIPLANGSEKLGALRIGFTMQSLHDRLLERYLVKPYKEIIVLAVGLIILQFVIIYVLILKIIKPILKLTDDLQEVGRGNLSIRSTFSHTDEIGFLSQAFNSMMDSLNSARSELERTHAHMVQTEKMAAMGKLAAGLAHEINNPLGGVLTCIETLKQDSQDEGLRTKYLELIHSGLHRIKRTVKQLLNFAEQRSFLPEPTDINVLVNRTLEMTSHHFSSNRISLHKNFDDNLSEILADPHQLIQVFVNLILNAVEAMPEGGDLWIKTCQEDGKVRIAIKDTGCGITEENLDRILDPFFSTKEPGQGTGLGLSVSYGIIQGHGGEIAVESQEFVGSEFSIVLNVDHHGDTN